MNSAAVRFWMAFAVLFASLYGAWTWWRVQNFDHQRQAQAAAVGRPAAAPRVVPDFQLTDQTGKPFDTASLRGRVWIASFFFANCPAICWRLNQALETVAADPRSADASLVSITCDPESDTPETLAAYGERFHADPARWKFLTGEMPNLQHIARHGFQVALEKASHSERVFVVDGQSRIRGQFKVLEPDEAEKMLRLIARLQSEK